VVSGCAALAQAPAPCDRFCALIKRAVEERANNFAKLQSEMVGDGLPSSISPPGMECSVEYYHDLPPTTQHPRGESYATLNCSTGKGFERDSKKQLKRVLDEFRRSEPKWKWFTADLGSFMGTSMTSYYGGTARNELYVSVEVSTTGGVTKTRLIMDSTPITVPGDMKPYSPRS
jgi:hypothetical protein